MFDISALSASYPTGEYIIGNFIETYISNSDILDKKFIRLFGEQSLRFDPKYTDNECIQEYNTTVQGIVFSHLNDWAKMYSALLAEYNPLWNVDGTVKTTYGATKDTTKYGPTKDTNIYGEQKDTSVIAQRTNTEGGGTDTHNTYKTTYPDATERKTDKGEDIIAQRTNTAGGGTDTLTRQRHTDTHETILHQDEKDSIEHVDTEVRTGNIGVTKSTDLVESEIVLRQKYNFFDVIFAVIVKELGAGYYE